MKEITLSSCRSTADGPIREKMFKKPFQNLLSKAAFLVVIFTLFLSSNDLYAQLDCVHTSETFATSDPSCPDAEEYDIAKIDRQVIDDEIFYVKVSGSACCGNFLVNPKSGNECFYDTSIAGPSGPDVVITEVGTVPDSCDYGELTKCSDGFSDVLEFTCSDGSTVGHRVTFLGFVEEGTDSYWYYHVENGVNSCMSDISHIAFGVVDDEVCCVDATANAGDDQNICIVGGDETVQVDGSIGGGASSSTWKTSGTGSFNNVSLLNAVYDPSVADIENGSVTLTLTTDDPAGPCLLASDDVVIYFYEKPDAGTDGSVEYCEDDTALSSIDLFAIITDEDAGGSWADTDASGVDLSDPTSVDFSSLNPGTYTFTYTVSPDNANSTCPDDDSVATIIIDEALYAGEDGEDRFCEGDENKDAVNLFVLIANEDTGGSWADTDGSGVDISDPMMVDFTGLTAGSYTFTYTVAPGAGSECLADSSEVEIIIDALPEIPETETQLADCLGGDGGFIFLGNPQNLYISFDDGETFELYEGAINLPVGTHDFIIKYGESGCPSEPGQVIIGVPQSVEFVLNVDITQPDCETGMGNVLIRIGDNTSIDTDYFIYTITSGAELYYEKKQPIGGFDLPPGTYLIEGVSDDGCDRGRIEVTLEEPVCEEFQGCTLGYWKNHTNQWCVEYQTCTLYGEVFEDAPEELEDLTLLEVLNLGGGGIYNLGRQSVAALLNACSNEVDYEMETTLEVIAYVNANFDNAGSAGTYLDMLNNAGCTLGGSKATSEPSVGCETGNNVPESSSTVQIYPVPFRDVINVGYDFDYSTDVTIQIFNMKGQHLRTYTDENVTRGAVTVLHVDFALKANQMYVLKIITDHETFVKQIVSSKK